LGKELALKEECFPKGRMQTTRESGEIEPKYSAILQQMEILTTEVSEASDKR